MHNKGNLEACHIVGLSFDASILVTAMPFLSHSDLQGFHGIDLNAMVLP